MTGARVYRAGSKFQESLMTRPLLARNLPRFVRPLVLGAAVLAVAGCSQNNVNTPKMAALVRAQTAAAQMSAKVDACLLYTSRCV